MWRRLCFLLMLLCCVGMTSAQKFRTHKVRSGETLRDVARAYGVTTKELRDANPGVTYRLQPGTKLRVPRTSASAQGSRTGSQRATYGSTLGSSLSGTSRSGQRGKAQPQPVLVDTVSSYGLMLWAFDHYENYGYFGDKRVYNGFGSEYAVRTNFKEFSNYNVEFGFNYSIGLFRGENLSCMLTAAWGPLSLRMQDTYGDGGNKMTKVYLDTYTSLRLSLHFGVITMTGGVFTWVPAWDFDDGMTGGCLGLQVTL